MSYSIWLLVSVNTMERVQRSFNTRQAARQYAERKGMVSFRVLRDMGSLQLE